MKRDYGQRISFGLSKLFWPGEHKETRMLDCLKNVMQLAVLASEDVVVAGLLQDALGESDEQIFIKLSETCWSDLLSMDPLVRKGRIRAELSRRDGNIDQGSDFVF